MAEECAGNSVATSTSTPLNWWYLQANSVPSWNNTNNTWNNQTNPNSSSSCEEDISVSTSFTNASHHSTNTVESSRRFVEPPAPSSNEFMGEHGSDNQLWSHVLLGVGSNNSQEIGENFLDALSSKSMGSTMFEPACDYLKKLDTNWDHHYNGSTSFNTFEKHLNGYSNAMIENNNERLTKLSNLVSTWSIAPPDPEVNNRHFVPQRTNMSLNSTMDHYAQSDPNCHIKQPSSGVFPNFYGHNMMRVKQQYHASEVPGDVFGKSSNTNGYQNGFNSLSPISCQRNFSDLISFNNKIRNNGGKGEGTAVREVKKKRCEESSETMLKKPKQDTSTASSTKVQAPKDKLADKITALQQIVSPFGKTDQASVLFEAIGYIKILQEEVQILCNPYLKNNNSYKDPWGRLDRKDKEDTKHDLRSKGLCLVPTSCTPLAYREITGPDYWTPAYRGCLYR
ncbi:hypothetical protein TanjilG_19242 [Lupinus angustifolius]|uniref:BHLH domain-containing protein n=1 Tax=Lupinus angustifolius TaxID=3871 RepID=A0A1J7FNJ0_LUPAN|nr:hypothetical protein TanjilG_19242 [Lupinus angustifolius]